jgi:hypothetical protein
MNFIATLKKSYKCFSKRASPFLRQNLRAFRLFQWIRAKWTSPPQNRWAPLLILVAVLADHATKIAAHYLLPFEREVVVWPGRLSFFSALNETSGTRQGRLSEELTPVPLAIAYLVMAAIAFLLSRSEKRLRAIFIGIAISVLVAGILVNILPSRLNIDPFDVRMFYVFTLVTFVTILCYISRQWYFRAGFGLILGGALGNLVSIFYPPFRVVDFIYIPTLSSAGLFAPFFNGTYIFNVADVCICAGTLLVHLAFVSILLKKLVIKVARESVLSLYIEEWRIPSRITFRYVWPAVALSCICGVVALSLTDSLRNLQHRFVDGSTYQGEWLDGEFHGRGTYTSWAGTVNEGEWREGKLNGQGRVTNSSGKVYEGELRNNLRHGYGKLTYSDDVFCEGEWRFGRMDGSGRILYANGSSYDGEWKVDERHGFGTFTYANGRVYNGEWQANQMHGPGTMTYANGGIYEGEWLDGRKNGHGTFTRSDGTIHNGEWRNGQPVGRMIFTDRNGSIYEGDWVNGRMVGDKIYSDANGAMISSE